jgi:ATP-dependent protease HslVU (ClpYQ) peptidase subunit
MTCIVGLAQDGKVYVGADSASSNGWMTRATKLPKVFKVGAFIIGYTSSFRMGQILQYHLEVRPQGDESDDEYMVLGFVEAVRECLKEWGFAKVDNNVETGGQFLVGYRGRLYHVDTDFQVNEMAGGFDACGSGQQFALGVVKVLEHLPPRERITKALEVSAYFSDGVMGPFQILEG